MVNFISPITYICETSKYIYSSYQLLAGDLDAGRPHLRKLPRGLEFGAVCIWSKMPWDTVSSIIDENEYKTTANFPHQSFS